MAVMSLGTFVFAIDTLLYEEISRRRSWRHAKSQRIGARDANQFVGPGEDDVSLSGQAVAELQDGVASLTQLASMADQGGIWPLVDGTGNVWGSYVITELAERSRLFFPNGQPRQIEFGLELSRVDDASAPAGTAA